MLSRSQRSSRRARGTKNRVLGAAVRPLLESLEGRRMLSVGGLDTSFNSTGYLHQNFNGMSLASALAIQPDGKILIASTQNDGDLIAIARYTSTGALDASFGDNPMTPEVDGGVISIDLVPGGIDYATNLVVAGGRIFVGGVKALDSDADIFVQALNMDGTPDTSFGTAILSPDGAQTVTGMVATSDGSAIYVSYNTQGGFLPPAIAKFDTTVLGGNPSVNSIPYAHTIDALAIQSDNKVIAAGWFTNGFGVARYEAGGTTLDTTGFGVDDQNDKAQNNGTDTLGIAISDPSGGIAAVAVDHAGHILTVGQSGDTMELIRYTTIGVQDRRTDVPADVSSVPNATVSYVPLGIAIDSTDRVVVTGHQDIVSSLPDPTPPSIFSLFVARFTSDTGALDTAFDTDGTATFQVVPHDNTGPGSFDQGNRVAIQTDDNIVVAGATDNDALLVRFIGVETTPPAPPPTPVYLDGSGNLVVPGTTGNDTFIVTSQIDGIHVNFNNVDSGEFNPTGGIIISGLDGDDAITVDSGVTRNTTINGGTGNDTISGGSGADSVSGGTGDDVISGNAGNDTISGDSGADSVSGGTGDDVISGNDGADTLRGSDGNDNLDGGAGNDLLVGGNGDDTLAGGDDNDVLNGNAGADSLVGGAGDDTLNGGADNDTSMGGSGSDLISNAGGDDSLNGEDGNDTLICGAGNDTALGEDGDDSIVGGTENDSLVGGAGEDTLNGGAGNDTLDGGSGNNSLIGGAGDDSLIAGNDNNTLNGGDGNDTITAGNGDNSVLGGNGDDVITTGTGNDTVNAGAGNDTVNAGDGNNSVIGGLGNDSLTTGSGNDTVTGNDGDDYIVAGDGADSIGGGAGNDIVVAGAGADIITGGDGRDILIGGTGPDSIVGNAEDDILIAGTTSHDANPTALNAILSEWISGRTYAQRVANIKNGTGGLAANGSYFFNPDVIIGGPAVSVFDDAAIDTVTGSAGSDWFLLNSDGGLATNDIITDLNIKLGEQSMDID